MSESKMSIEDAIRVMKFNLIAASPIAKEAVSIAFECMTEAGQLLADLAAANAEIQRLNGRRCDQCEHGKPYYGPDQMKIKSAIWCTVNSGMDERVSKRFEFGEHYCKSWEKR